MLKIVTSQYFVQIQLCICFSSKISSEICESMGFSSISNNYSLLRIILSGSGKQSQNVWFIFHSKTFCCGSVMLSDAQMKCQIKPLN